MRMLRSEDCAEAQVNDAGKKKVEEMLRLLDECSIHTPEEAACLLMTASILAESIALDLSVEHALRTREEITKTAKACPVCRDICLCNMRSVKGEYGETIQAPPQTE